MQYLVTLNCLSTLGVCVISDAAKFPLKTTAETSPYQLDLICLR
jgi:hypothetical protein